MKILIQLVYSEAWDSAFFFYKIQDDAEFAGPQNTICTARH